MLTDQMTNVVEMDQGRRLTAKERRDCQQGAISCDEIATLMEMDGSSRFTVALRNNAALFRQLAK